MQVAFDPTTALVAACSGDTCHLWRLDSGSETARLTHDSTVVQRPAFSPDGATIATPGWDGTARLWAATPERLAEQGCAEAGRTLTESEWPTYVGDRPYRPRCS
jgi:WD40 repeat protein